MDNSLTWAKSLVLAYLELQRQIDAHSKDWPYPDVVKLKHQQEQIIGSLDEKATSALSNNNASQSAGDTDAKN